MYRHLGRVCLKIQYEINHGEIYCSIPIGKSNHWCWWYEFWEEKFLFLQTLIFLKSGVQWLQDFSIDCIPRSWQSRALNIFQNVYLIENGIGIGYDCCTFVNLSWNKTTNWQKLTLAFANRIYSSQTLIFVSTHIWTKGQRALVVIDIFAPFVPQ